MSIQATATATAINLIIAGIYCIEQRKVTLRHVLASQMSGVILASMINSTRPYTEMYLKQCVDEHYVDYIYGASSVLIMGLAAYYAKLSLKVNLTATLFLQEPK